MAWTAEKGPLRAFLAWDRPTVEGVLPAAAAGKRNRIAAKRTFLPYSLSANDRGT